MAEGSGIRGLGLIRIKEVGFRVLCNETKGLGLRVRGT